MTIASSFSNVNEILLIQSLFLFGELLLFTLSFIFDDLILLFFPLGSFIFLEG
jgi:hypothetical protein